MENLFKKFVYTGVGLVSTSADKAKVFFDKLVEEGKVSAEEGKKIVEEFNKNTETKKEELETQFSSIVEKIVKSFKFVTNDDINELANRVTMLEAVLANRKDAEAKEVSKPAKKTTTRAKKTTTPKTDTKKKEE